MQLNMFFFVFYCFIKFPLQTEKHGYYCFLIFHYMKCKLKKIISCLIGDTKSGMRKTRRKQLAECNSSKTTRRK